MSKEIRLLNKGELLVNEGENRDLSVYISDLNTEEFFQLIKSKMETLNPHQLSDILKNLDTLIENTNISRQIILNSKLKFQRESLESEEWLINNGFNRYIDKYDLYPIITELDRQNNANVLFCELDKFTRVIPKEAINKIAKLNERNIFDNYYVLYASYTLNDRAITENTPTDSSRSETVKKEVKKDPILLGEMRGKVIIKDSDGVDKSVYASNPRLYIIHEWDDEYCHINLSSILKLDPDIIHDHYGTEIDIDIEDRPTLETIE